jgi:hypothetical protein
VPGVRFQRFAAIKLVGDFIGQLGDRRPFVAVRNVEHPAEKANDDVLLDPVESFHYRCRAWMLITQPLVFSGE